MRTKIFMGVVLSILGLTFFAGEVVWTAKRTIPRSPLVLPMDGATPPEAYTGPSPVMYERGRQPDCEDIHPTIGYEYVIQHDQFGSTYYDKQKNGSMGRMIAVSFGGHRHTIFHETRGPYSEQYPRYVTYNCKNPASVWCGPLQADGGAGINAGYSQMLLLHDGTEILLYHRVAPPIGCWHSTFAKGEVGYPCQCNIPYLYDVPDYHDNAVSDEPNGMWPKGCIVYDAAGDTDYIHIISNESNPVLGGDQTIAYQRCVFEETDIVCYSPGGLGPYRRSPGVAGNETDSIAVFDSIKCISAIVVSSPVSQRVAVVYTKHREDSQVNNDVVYVESMNNGDDWLAGTPWPPIRYNVSNYDPLDPERAFADVAACYDYNDSLHTVWNGTWCDSAGESFSVTWANLKHWSKEHGISTIATAPWEETAPGSWNRNISKMSISALDPVYHPGGDPDSVYLFCIWTQFNEGDMSQAGYTNGDIYAAVSSDGGATWSPRVNLTNTKTPDCAAGECLGEHYSSLAENLYDGDLHIQYVCDRDPGRAVGNEGAWTDNPMMYLHLAQPPAELHCGLTYILTDPPSFCDPPIKVLPGGFRIVTLELSGIYNYGGDYEVATDHPKVTCINNCSGYIPPEESKDVGLKIDCGGEEDFINATIIIRCCVGTEDEYTIEIILHAVCSEDYYECARDPATFIEKDNSKLKVWACVNSEEREWDERIDPEENQQVIFSGGIIVATTADGYYDTVVGRQDYRDTRTGARDTIKVVVGSMEPYFPDEPCTLQKIYSEKTFICANNLRPPESYNHDKWWWISVNKQILMFHGPDCPNWKKEQVIKYVWIRWNPPPIWWPDQSPFVDYEEIYFGVFADVEAPFDTGCNGCNAAGYDYTRHIMWQHGYNAGSHPEYEQYYVGMALTDREGGVVEPWGAHNVLCEDYLYPQGGWGWKEGELYQLASDSGVSIAHPDSVADRTVVMTADMIPAGNDSTFDLEFILIEAFIATGLADLQAHIDQTREILIPQLDDLGVFSREFPICGDANGDGSVDLADAVYIINYLFIGAPPPFWPITRGDANGDGSVDLADAVYLVNWLFIGGPPPTECYGFGRE